MSDGKTRIRGSDKHIETLVRYVELRETIERWSNQWSALQVAITSL
jgi:hypothetical protein